MMYILISLILGLVYWLTLLYRRIHIYKLDQTKLILDLDISKGKIKEFEPIKQEFESTLKELEIYKQNVKGLNKKVVELKKQLKNG